MPYTDTTTVRVLLNTTASQSQTASSLTDEAINQAITDADAEIDARLADRYSVPFSSPAPSVVSSLSTNIAAYLADLTYRQSREYASRFSPLYLRYQRCLEMLDRLSKGDDSLPGVDPVGGTALVINPYTGDLMTEEDVFSPPTFS